jgi:hypothetical protein
MRDRTFSTLVYHFSYTTNVPKDASTALAPPAHRRRKHHTDTAAIASATDIHHGLKGRRYAKRDSNHCDLNWNKKTSRPGPSLARARPLGQSSRHYAWSEPGHAVPIKHSADNAYTRMWASSNSTSRTKGLPHPSGVRPATRFCHTSAQLVYNNKGTIGIFCYSEVGKQNHFLVEPEVLK